MVPDSMAEVTCSGWVMPGFEPVQDRFRANFVEYRERGAAFAATLDGELVVDLWGGCRDDAGTPWQEDTLGLIFSGSKGLVAICMLRLIERGLLDLDTPVCRYWPEFASHGKDAVLVRHVVSHQAGLPGLRRPLSLGDIPNAERMAALLADEELFWPAGSRVWYHLLTYGWLCGELVRRVTGQTLGSYLRTEITQPTGIEAWIGLPPELEPRVATCRLDATWRQVATGDAPGDISPADVHDILYNPPGMFADELPWNSPAWHAGEIPGANGIATARAIASLYGALACGGKLGDIVVLSPSAIELGQELIAEGIDPIDGDSMRFGVGWRVQNDAHELGPPAKAFGHGGAGGSQHGAWPDERVGFSYLMNLMCDERHDMRSRQLLDALHGCVVTRRGAS